jgi:hypothetical protein
MPAMLISFFSLLCSSDVLYAVAFGEAVGLPIAERPETDEVRVIDFVDGKFYAPHLYSHLGRIRVSLTRKDKVEKEWQSLTCPTT